MKKILVTGCNGFIGRNTCSRFIAMGHMVCGVDIAGVPEPGVFRFLQGQITPEALTGLGAPFDVIIHLAGPGTVSAANQDAEKLSSRILNNIRILLELTRLHPETLLIFPSSAAVYGNQYQSFIREDSPLKPFSRYGSNKVAEETLCEEYHRNYGSRVCITRLFSIYGSGLRKQLLWDFSRRLADARRAGKKAIPCFGTGEETRDYIHIDDVVRCFDFFICKNPDWLTVNVGTGTAHSVRQVLTELVAAYGFSMELDFDGIVRPDNPMHLLAEVTRLKSLGFVPSVSFETGLARYASWAKNELNIPGQ